MKINDKIFDNFPILKSDRLLLRNIKLSDATKIFEMRSNGRVNQFITRDNMNEIEDAIKLVQKTILSYQSRQAIGWAGVLRDGADIIGTCGFNSIDYANLRAEIGGELSVDYWGKNIALEAVMIIVKFGLDIMNLHTIEAKVSPENKGVIVLLQKIGFKKEAHYVDRIFYNNKFYDITVYTLVKGNESYGC
ncbi:MAG: GNAT family N-acetyltransferase [Ignavibacteria bacterium]|nr:GNAT family N-acetyltransferase [Ignavibacteria bacterium]